MQIRNAILLFIVTLAFSSFSYADYYVIVNNKRAENSVTKKDLNKIFLGYKTRWEDGGRVRPVLLKHANGDIIQFYTDVLQMTPKKFISYWRRKLFAGRGTPPKKLKANKSVVDFVAFNENAIGVVTQKPESAKVKIVSIQ